MAKHELTLTAVQSQRVHYRPHEAGAFQAVITNLGDTPRSGTLVWQVVADLEHVVVQGVQVLSAVPGSPTTVAWSAPLADVRYGAEIRAWLKEAPDEVRRDVFGVSEDVGTVGLLGSSRYANYTDEFAWAPDDYGNMNPDEEEWWAGQVGWRRNKAALRRKIADGHSRGIKALTYGKGVSGGRDGMRLLLEKPEWAAFNRFGQLGGLDMSFDVWSLKHWDDPGRTWGFWNSWTPNFLTHEPVRHGAEAIIKSAVMFGWDGVRFDAQFDIFGGYDIAGSALPTGAARSAVNARNVTLMKTHIRERLPHFTFGYNYGLPMPIPSALDEAVSAGGGLIMDEGIRNASDPQHPLQEWRRYARHILEESAAVRRLGGVPLIFSSGLKGVAAEYGIGFCLAGGGTPYGWVFGDADRAYDAFATRYSELLWNPAYRFAADPETALQVSADNDCALWWRDWVRSGQAPDGTPRLVVHLFNPPPAPTLRATTEAPRPATGVRITLSGAAAADVRSAWLLTCDSQPRQRRLTPTAAGGDCSLEIGEIGQWGILVLDGKVAQAVSARLRIQELPEGHEPRVGRGEGKPLPPPLDIKPFVPDEEESAASDLAREEADGRIVLANRHLRFVIDPRRGGRVASFVDRRDGLERIVPGRLEGLFFDTVYDQDGMLYQGQWGIHQAAAYTGEILENGPETARVLVSRAAIDTEHGVTNENYTGLVIEREFRLARNDTTLACIVRLRNTAAEGRCPAYALRNGYVDGAQRQGLRYYRPSRRGIHTAGPGLAETDPMVWDPAAGWTATADTASGRGAAWLLEAGRVMMFYNSTAAVTGRLIEEFPNRHGVDPLYIWDNASDTAIGADWYYRRAFIPAGAVWETRVTLVPLQQARGAVAHADPHAVVTVCWPEAATPTLVTVTVLPSVEPFEALRVVLEADARELELARTEDGRFAGQTPAARPALAHLRIEGRTGDGKPHLIRFPYLSSPAPSAAPPVLPPPPPRLDYQSDGTPAARAQTTHQTLLLEGLGFEQWGLSEALAGHGMTLRSSEFMKRRIATAVRYFPATLEEAQHFDLIVLGAVDAFALSHDGVAILTDYVRSGGTLLALGGLYSFGGGRFVEFGLDALLPLRVRDTFDLRPVARETPAWTAAVQPPASQPLPTFGSLAWMHDLAPAADARVLAVCGGRPLVALREEGRGRVMAVAATPLGLPADDRSWLETHSYLLRNLLPDESERHKQ